MMQPIEDRNRDDVAGTLWQSRNRLLLVNALMRPNSIVEAHEFGDQASQVRLVEYEHVVEQLAPSLSTFEHGPELSSQTSSCA